MESPYYYGVSRCRYIFFTITFFLGAQSMAQTSDQLPFKEVIDSLSEVYQVNVSYLDQTIEDIQIKRPDFKQELSSLLVWISSATGLLVEQTGNREYALFAPSAQQINICGRLVDAQSGEYIVGALVYTADKVALSNGEGLFSIPSIKKQKVQVQHLGFKSLIITDFDEGVDCKTYEMVPEPTILQEINIYNYLSDGINKVSDGSVMLTVNPSRLMPGQVETDVLHALRFLPGVQSATETVSDLNIRGGTMDQNLILFDGMRVYQQGHFFGQLSVFNPNLIKRSRVIKHGTSVQFGDAVSGTILLETDERVSEDVAMTIGTNLLYSDIGLELPLGSKASVELSGRRSTEDLYTAPIYHNFFNKSFSNTEVLDVARDSIEGVRDRFHFNDFALQINYKPDPRTSILLSGINVNNNLEFDEQGVQQNDLLTKTSRLSQNSQIGSLTIKRKQGQTARTTLQLGVSHYMLNAANNDITQDQLLQQKNQVLDYQLKSVTQIIGNHQDDWLFGYQYNNLGILNSNEINNPVFREIEKRVNSVHALFGEYYRQWNQFQVQSGTRLQYYQEASKLILEPRLSLSRDLNDKMKLQLTAEQKSQSLFQKIDLQEDFFGIEKRRWNFPRSSDFLLLTSRQLSLGYHYQGFRWLLDVEGFYKSIRNIRSLSQGFVNQLEKLDLIGINEIWGGEVLSTYRLKDLRIWLSYSYMVNQYNFSDFSPSVFSSNIEIPHNLTWGSTYRYRDLEVAGSLNWRSGIPYTGVNSTSVLSNQIDYDEPNQFRIKNYFRTDLSFQYNHQLGNSRIVTGISAWNILNHSNLLRQFYAVNDKDELTLIVNEALPFTFNAFVRWRWLQSE